MLDNTQTSEADVGLCKTTLGVADRLPDLADLRHA